MDCFVPMGKRDYSELRGKGVLDCLGEEGYCHKIEQNPVGKLYVNLYLSLIFCFSF